MDWELRLARLEGELDALRLQRNDEASAQHAEAMTALAALKRRLSALEAAILAPGLEIEPLSGAGPDGRTAAVGDGAAARPPRSRPKAVDGGPPRGDPKG